MLIFKMVLISFLYSLLWIRVFLIYLDIKRFWKLCAYVCVYVRVCTRARVPVRMWVCVYVGVVYVGVVYVGVVYVDVLVSVCMSVRVCVCVCLRLCVRARASVGACVRACVWVCVCCSIPTSSIHEVGNLSIAARTIHKS